MRSGIRLSIIALFIIITFFIVPSTSAHPLGNFTINHYDGIHFAADKVWVDFVLDMAEIPAFQEISRMVMTPDGKKPDPAGLPAYANRQCQSIGPDLALQVNGTQASLALAQSGVSFPPGAAGLSTLRLTCTFQNSSLKVSSNDRIEFADNSYSDRIGWREIVVTPDGIQLQGDFTTSSISKELTSYPQDMLSSPLDVRQVSLTVGTAATPLQNAASANTASQKTAPWSVGARSDRFTELITLQALTPTSILIALLIAFVWGGLHSLTPGHGKTLAGAYLIGNRGTALHALYLGLMTTFTHTAGVFLLGMVTLIASRFILPDLIFPWISALSGLLVVVIGITLIASRLRSTQAWVGLVKRIKKLIQSREAAQASAPSKTTAPLFTLTVANLSPEIQQKSVMAVSHRHADETALVHEAGHSHADEPGHTHAGLHLLKSVHTHEDWHHHTDGTYHTHDDMVHTHEHAHPHVHPSEEYSHADVVHMHEHDHPHIHSSEEHSHDPLSPHGHSHLPPGASGGKVTMRSLLALGISGGLLPCPSALVVMLGAIALNRIAFGVVLVLAFSLGLASVLTGIGLALVYARRYFDRLPIHSKFIELIPASSAVFITILGIGITMQSLTQLGWFAH